MVALHVEDLTAVVMMADLATTVVADVLIILTLILMVVVLCSPLWSDNLT